MGFSVFVLTWNIDGKVPRGELRELLKRSPAPDIYAIGLQELESSEQASRSYYSSYSRGSEKKHEKEQEWEECLENTLPGYVKLTTTKLDGIVLFIYIQQSLTPVVENLETKSCGLYSRSEHGPKGVIAVRFELGGFSFCFANCHLSSQSETLEQRNQEYYVIWDILKFPSGRHIYDHDRVFMLGSLNGRAERGENFEGFIEAEELNKSDDHSDDYSPHYSGRRTSPKDALLPGGPDRILYKGQGALKVEEYQQHPYSRLSDHKPVTGFYRFNYPSYVEIKNSEAWNSYGVVT